jgi:hypothetical protein
MGREDQKTDLKRLGTNLEFGHIDVTGYSRAGSQIMMRKGDGDISPISTGEETMAINRS